MTLAIVLMRLIRLKAEQLLSMASLEARSDPNAHPCMVMPGTEGPGKRAKHQDVGGAPQAFSPVPPCGNVLSPAAQRSSQAHFPEAGLRFDDATPPLECCPYPTCNHPYIHLWAVLLSKQGLTQILWGHLLRNQGATAWQSQESVAEADEAHMHRANLYEYLSCQLHVVALAS